MARSFDPELLYVECSRCGSPVIWGRGETTEIISWAGVEGRLLDWSCLVLSEGCPSCSPGRTSFLTRVVRLAPGHRAGHASPAA